MYLILPVSMRVTRCPISCTYLVLDQLSKHLLSMKPPQVQCTTLNALKPDESETLDMKLDR